jgi:hypothetical protein
MVSRLLVQYLHPPQKSERPPFCNGCSYGIKNYSFEAIFNCMTYVLNVIKIYELLQNLLGVRRRYRTVISLTYRCPLGRKAG